jgi:hypothetical protein
MESACNLPLSQLAYTCEFKFCLLEFASVSSICVHHVIEKTKHWCGSIMVGSVA